MARATIGGVAGVSLQAVLALSAFATKIGPFSLLAFGLMLVTWWWSGCEQSGSGTVAKGTPEDQTGPKAATYDTGCDTISVAAPTQELLHAPPRPHRLQRAGPGRGHRHEPPAGQ